MKHEATPGRQYLATLITLCTAVLLPSACLAQTTADLSGNVGRLLSNPSVQQILINSAKQSSVMINQPCPDAQYSIETTIGILKPLEFNGAGLLTSGAWTQPVREEGCGKSRRLNVLALSKNETQIATQALLPGTTRADPLLQRDALTNLFTVAQIVVHEPNDTCKTQYVSDTEFLGEAGQPREGAQHPPWREMWTVSSCTKRSAVPVLFTPGAVGTSFVIGPQNAVNVVPLE